MSIDFGEPEQPPRGAAAFGTPPGPGMPPAPGALGYPPAAPGQASGTGLDPAGSATVVSGAWGAPSFGDNGYGAGGYGGAAVGGGFGQVGLAGGFVEDPVDLVPSVPGKPPVLWLVAAILMALVAGGLSLVFGSLPVILVCWLCAGPVAVTLLAQFRTRDLAARARTTYLGGSWVTGLAVTTGIVILVAVGMTAFAVGRWVAYA